MNVVLRVLRKVWILLCSFKDTTMKHTIFLLTLLGVLTACGNQQATKQNTKTGNQPTTQSALSQQAHTNLDKAKNTLDEANAENANRLAQVENQ